MKRDVTVAVIGAGPAGLNALRVLNHRPPTNSHPTITTTTTTEFKATAFEQKAQIGGTWFYSDAVGTDEEGLPLHSSIYKSLRTNLPKEIMGYPDFPFPAHLPSFISHEDMYRYLKDYATNFNLWGHIQFKTIVEHIKPVSNETKPFEVKWEITTADVTNRKNKQTRTFDAVLVCNGHFTRPLMPEVPGLDFFGGHVIHSYAYRRPDAYRNKRVVVIGAKQSGLDISCEVAALASRVYLSHNKTRLSTILHPNVEQKPGIKRCSNGGVVEFLDGSRTEADAIILCTGYLYDFGFLDDSIGIKVKDERVAPLYKHFLSVDYPSLGLVGAVKTALPLPVSHFQNMYFRSILEGSSSTLPSREEMLQDEEKEFQAYIVHGGYPPRYAHDLYGRLFTYFRELAQLGHFHALPPVQEEIYNAIIQLRSANATTYKNNNFILSDLGTDFKIVTNTNTA